MYHILSQNSVVFSIITDRNSPSAFPESVVHMGSVRCMVNANFWSATLSSYQWSRSYLQVIDNFGKQIALKEADFPLPERLLNLPRKPKRKQQISYKSYW